MSVKKLELPLLTITTHKALTSDVFSEGGANIFGFYFPVQEMVAIDVRFEVSITTDSMEKTTFLASCSGQDGEEDMERGHCKDYKCQLVDYNSLPNFLKHNEFILDYYRSEWPMKQTILSIFKIHNETINVWTHLLGFLFFLALVTTTVMVFPSIPSPAHQQSVSVGLDPASTFNISQHSQPPSAMPYESNTISPSQANLTTGAVPVARWPFYAYLCGVMFCMLMSSACHLLSCHSEHTCYVMLRLDYAGISALIVTSFYPLVYYSFACNPFYKDLYIGFITVFGAATILVSLAPVFETPEFRYVRSGLFVCMAVSGLVPIVHKSVMFGHHPEAMLTTGYEMVMALFYGLGVLLYVARVPERWMPGKFDLAGHSHQLFHVLIIAGAYMHYLAGLVYLQWREMDGF